MNTSITLLLLQQLRTRLGHALLVCALTAASSAALVQESAAHDRGAGSQMMNGGHSERHIERLARFVDLSAEQKAKVQALHKAAEPQLLQLRSAVQAERQKMTRLLGAATVDKAAIEQQRQVVSTAHDKASQAVMLLMTDIAQVLTPEQRSKLVQMADTRAKRGHHHHRG